MLMFFVSKVLIGPRYSTLAPKGIHFWHLRGPGGQTCKAGSSESLFQNVEIFSDQIRLKNPYMYTFPVSYVAPLYISNFFDAI